MASDIQLSKCQQEAVEADWKNKISLIISTAGSGKTLTLTRRAVRIASELAEDNAVNSRILCVCFNASAAEEMCDRIMDLVLKNGFANRINVTRKHFVPKDMVTIEVRTFHALGYWIIRTALGHERNCVGLRQGKVKLLDGKNHLRIIQEALVEANVVPANMGKRDLNKISKKCERDFRLHKRKNLEMECEKDLSPADADRQPQAPIHLISKQAYEMYVARMNEQNSIDYEDMISKPIALIKNVDRLREKMASRFAAVLVDEFQDLTPAEFVICKALVEKSKSLTMVGDDDQQIYSFRSSRTWYCHEMVHTWFSENLEILQLSENRRCPGAVVKSATAVIEKNSRRARKRIESVRAVGQPVKIVGCQNLRLQTGFVVKRIRSLLPNLKKSKEQILVLFRTNHLLNIFQGALQTAGVPTTRVLSEPGRTDSIGSRTSATFALIALMSNNVDRATFVWAAVTVVPALDRSFVECVLACQTQSTQNRGSKGKSKAHGSTHIGDDEGIDVKPSLAEKPFPSPYVKELQDWYESHREDVTDFRKKHKSEHLHRLFEKIESLILLVRNLNSAEKLVEAAERVVSFDEGGEFEDYPEFSASQLAESETPVVETGKEGYDLLISVARKIDECDYEDDDNVYSNIQAPACKGVKADEEDEEDEDEDFSSLFKQDAKSRTQKRKKFLGGSDVHTGNVLLRRKALGKKINEFCDTLETTLTRSDRSGSKKVSQTERPSTVLSTIHKAKGTSFAYVFLCGADIYNLPNTGRYQIDRNGAIDMNSLQTQEERRLFFVSLTRTQREFTCTYSVPEEECRPSPHSTNPRKWQSPFLEELWGGLDGDKACVTELFIQYEKDIEAVIKALQTKSE